MAGQMKDMLQQRVCTKKPYCRRDGIGQLLRTGHANGSVVSHRTNVLGAAAMLIVSLTDCAATALLILQSSQVVRFSSMIKPGVSIVFELLENVIVVFNIQEAPVRQSISQLASVNVVEAKYELNVRA